ncbi:TetR/AcrR family transcriptional regulator [Bradyrhizobium sp. SK17]|uniref:TetR/AcrR family transcriptional regulator n=1 Tax=Bradyrhizobium sp. SK17 TaxID=2057741 RepID=UPI000C314605|nr:TetR/AcrR family transcriptional regulator [Bradyrhizobium sp. SK17]AUC93239.1 TetR/AcrR family transcriptional regulator [Bradyrhizobium sp. SK17]
MSIEERSSKGARRFQRRARQEADKAALKALILKTARKEFAAGTLETVSIQKIADAIGYSKGTVLKYYPTKLLLLLAVKQQNLEAVAGQLERVRAQTADSDLRLRQVMETYLDYWADNPDHFRSLFSMSGTIEDRRFPDGVYFGETEIARRSYELFVISVREYLAARGAEPASGLPQRLASALLAATHGVVALTLGTPTMKLPDMRATGRLLIASLIDAWTSKLAAARTSEGWPRITISTFA